MKLCIVQVEIKLVQKFNYTGCVVTDILDDTRITKDVFKKLIILLRYKDTSKEVENGYVIVNTE